MRAQYVNQACSRALSYDSPSELMGRHVDEAVTSDKNPIDVYGKIQQQLDAGQVSNVSHCRSAVSARNLFVVRRAGAIFRQGDQGYKSSFRPIM